MGKNYLKEATNPQQYDSGFLNYDGSSDSPARRFFQEHLQPHLAIKGKSVVDIGSGMGQLFPLLKELGASEVQGIEPSLKNIEVSHKVYPDINVFHGTLADFPEARQFSTATAIMVFEHIGNLLDAFAKINRILSKEGEFFLVVADK